MESDTVKINWPRVFTSVVLYLPNSKGSGILNNSLTDLYTKMKMLIANRYQVGIVRECFIK